MLVLRPLPARPAGEEDWAARRQRLASDTTPASLLPGEADFRLQHVGSATEPDNLVHLPDEPAGVLLVGGRRV